jgi:hypothetical protein
MLDVLIGRLDALELVAGDKCVAGLAVEPRRELPRP